MNYCINNKQCFRKCINAMAHLPFLFLLGCLSWTGIYGDLSTNPRLFPKITSARLGMEITL